MIKLIFILLIAISYSYANIGNQTCNPYTQADCDYMYSVCRDSANTKGDPDMCDCIKNYIQCLKDANCYDEQFKNYLEKLCKDYKCDFCQKKKKDKLNGADIAVITIFSIFVIIILIAICVKLFNR